MPPRPAVPALAMPAHALVTGASRGIGLAVSAHLLADASVACVYAVARQAEASADLAVLAEVHGPRLQCIDADLTHAEALAGLAARVGACTDALHLVFNAAGVLHSANVSPEKSVAALSADALAQVFAINAFAPILLAQALLPLLPRRTPAVFASVSARVGSIGDNRLGGWYAYRASKAAQNQLLRTLAVELRRSHPLAICVALHPGTVDTGLSRPFQANVPAQQLFTPDRAARQLLDVIAALGSGDSGRFIAWDGSDIPW